MAARRKILIWGIIAILVIVIALAGTLLLTIHPYFYGLNKISARNGRVYIRCTEFYGCTVESVGPDATAFKGERECPINDDLGDYVVKVRFGDAKVSQGFDKKYSGWTTYPIGNSGFSFMCTSDGGDHGIVIFIGSDEPIDESDIVIRGIRDR